MIEDDIETHEEFKPLLEAETVEEAPARKAVPWKAVIVTGLLVSLIGAGGGGYGVYAGLKAQTPDIAANSGPDAATLMAPLNKKIKTLETRLSAAEALTQTVSDRPVPVVEPVDLSSVETRIEALEAAPVPDIDPVALTALQSAQADGFEWPDTSGLETRLTGLETQVNELPEAIAPDAMLEILDRLEVLETDLATAVPPSAAMTTPISGPDADAFDSLIARVSALENRAPLAAKVQHVAVLAFPKAAMLSAIEDNAEGGFMKKTLSKHIRVKDENGPLTLIEGIEADIAKGRLKAAVEKFERLPVPVKAAGQAWYESVRASL